MPPALRIVLLILAAGCGPGAGRTPSPVQGLYRHLIGARVNGAPSTEQLNIVAPFLSTELKALLDSARALRDAESKAHPDQKPPFAEGDLFSSLFEGPTGFEVLPEVGVPEGRKVPVRFRDERPSPVVEWTDTVLVQEEGGRTVVADVKYGATWDFANRGSLVGALRAGLRPESAATWILEMQGIGPLKIGMTLAQAEPLAGAARVDRIEPGAECGWASFANVPRGISFMVTGDTLVRTSIDTTGFSTAKGVAVGSRENEVLAAYAGMIRVEPHKYTGPEGHYLIVEDPAQRGFRLIFETDGKAVTTFRAGRLPEVEYIEGCA